MAIWTPLFPRVTPRNAHRIEVRSHQDEGHASQPAHGKGKSSWEVGRANNEERPRVSGSSELRLGRQVWAMTGYTTPIGLAWGTEQRPAKPLSQPPPGLHLDPQPCSLKLGHYHEELLVQPAGERQCPQQTGAPASELFGPAMGVLTACG